jgi:general stress protein 26
MSQTDDGRHNAEINRLLRGAAKTIANVRSCWLVTEADSGGSDARPMGRVQPDHDDWTIRFITDRRSQKTSDIRRAGKVGLIFQSDPDEAFVALSGTATLIEAASEVRQLWKEAYNALIPAEADRANAALIQVGVERMKLWIRGLTEEPFGLRATVLERDAGGIWRLVRHDRNDA